MIWLYNKKMGYIDDNQKRKRRLLLVDDESDITFSLKIFLEDNGFQVNTFNKPSSVLLDFRAGLYDLIILDIKMPEINGLTLYKKIRKIDNKVQVLFLTALSDFSNYIQPNDTSSILNEKNIILKPIDNDALLKIITTMEGTSIQ